MNSEELEQSLRTEFESYLKSVIESMRGDVDEFQLSIQTQFDQHKTHIDEAFASFSSRFDNGEHAIDEGFKESVVEHLRLARDEGAKITAAAIAEAEELDREMRPVADFAGIRDAIADISAKETQSAILRSLIEHASNFATRGAFFIVRNEHFVGWKVFGKESETGENAIRDIHFPMSDDTILAESVRSLATVEGMFGRHDKDGEFLEPLEYGHPDRMYAVPLVARGRGVAVLYADYGSSGVKMDTNALEILVRVAGLTVEKLANDKVARAEGDAYAPADAEIPEEQHSPEAVTEQSYQSFDTSYSQPEIESSPVIAEGSVNYEAPEFGGFERSHEPEPQADDTVHDEPEADSSFVPVSSGYEFEPSPSAEPAAEEQDDHTPSWEAPPAVETDEHTPAWVSETSDETPYEVEPVAEETVEESEQPVYEFDDNTVAETAEEVVEPSMVYDAVPVETYEPEPEAEASPVTSFTPEPAVTPAAPEPASTDTYRPRLSDRRVDLPIEVPEEERRLHNDARRFARLLVSEIKLYNEKKVQEGRDSSDLYDRLREAIDRSREMYDKRVQSPVSEKFDYFHYELVNSLADGDEARLGSSYVGNNVPAA